MWTARRKFHRGARYPDKNGTSTSRGCRDGTVVRALGSHRYSRSGFDSWNWHHMRVEFVVGSCPCFKCFSLGSLVFLPPQTPILQIPIRTRNEGHRFVSFALKCHPCEVRLIIIIIIIVGPLVMKQLRRKIINAYMYLFPSS